MCEKTRETLLASLFLLSITALALGAFTPSPNETVNAPPDDDEAQERRAFARRTVSENCTICHAPDLIEAQRLTPKQWKAEVEKMIGWGAPLPAEQVATVIDYLGAEYPVARQAASATNALGGRGQDEHLPRACSRGTTEGRRLLGRSPSHQELRQLPWSRRSRRRSWPEPRRASGLAPPERVRRHHPQGQGAHARLRDGPRCCKPKPICWPGFGNDDTRDSA